MEVLSAATVQLLTFLLPGFTAAWLFYGLTSHAKPSQFERVVQALVLTFVVQAFLPIVRWILLCIGTKAAAGPWDKDAELVSSLLLAVLIGGAVAYCTNNDVLHRTLRSLGFTTRTSHPSEWYCVFSERVTYVVLHLKDGRRLYGWPKEWPIDAQKGQFYMQEPSWIDENGWSTELPELDGILVHACEVEWVEFLRLGESE